MLSSLIRLPLSAEQPSVEDIFSSSLGLIFTDTLRNQHGDPGSYVIYKSKAYGDLELRLVDPEGEENRRLFAQYLWNAGVLVAELIGGGTEDGQAMLARGGSWSVKGEKVLELGAGTGLAGIVAVLAGAEMVTMTDYPAEEILANIRSNVEKNLIPGLQPKARVQGHEWGALTDDFSYTRARGYTRIIAADCLWMPWEHTALAQSMVQFLSHEEDAKVWVVAGFHTGRAKLAPFFDVAVQEGLEVEDIWERDSDGYERGWMKERDGAGEDVGERKKWLVIAVLRRQLSLDSTLNRIGKERG